MHCTQDAPLRERLPAGEESRLKLEDESPLLACGLGDTSVVGGSEKTSEGVSRSGVNIVRDSSCGGKAGSDLSTLGPADAGGFLLDFLRRRAMRDSWHVMQKIP